MKQKYDAKYERQIRELAENRFQTGNYKVFDDRARIITRKDIGGKDCLMIANSDGEVFAITPIFQAALWTALQNSF